MELAENKTPERLLPNGLEKGKKYCLANEKIFFWAALNNWDIILQDIVDALFPEEGYHLDGAIMEVTFKGTGYVKGSILDSLSIDREKGILFDIEMQLYDLDRRRAMKYYDAIRRKADVGKGYGVPIKKIYVIFCCNRNPIREYNRPIYYEALGLRDLPGYDNEHFEFLLINMAADHPEKLKTIFEDLLCKEPEKVKDPRYAKLLKEYNDNPEKIRRKDMTLQEYNQGWENRLKASQAKYDEDLKALRAENETAIKAIRAENETAIKAIRAENETAMKAIRAETEAAYAQAEAAHAETEAIRAEKEAIRAEKEAARAEKETLIEAAAVSLLSQGVGEAIVAESLRLPIERVRELSKRL